MKLGEEPWWRPLWRYRDDDPVPATTVSKTGVLTTCYILAGDLIIEAECNGTYVHGRIGRSVNAPNLKSVQKFLKDYEGESIELIESLEIDANQFNTR